MSTGFHDSIPEAEYHADRNSLSVSGAKVLLRSPAHFRWQQEHPVYRDVFDFGSAAHKLVLGVGADLIVFQYDAEKVRSPKSTNAWKDKQAEVRKAGNILLLPEEYAAVQAMADKLSEHTLAMRLLSNGKPEVSAYAVDPETGITRRGRFDWLGEAILTDYKTCASADPRDWSGKYGVINKYGYAMQAAWYLDLARDLGHDAQAWCWIAQEKEAPYAVSVIEVDEEDLYDARQRNRRALEIYRDCMEADVWPSYLPDTSFARVSLSSPVFEERSLA